MIALRIIFFSFFFVPLVALNLRTIGARLKHRTPKIKLLEPKRATTKTQKEKMFFYEESNLSS